MGTAKAMRTQADMDGISNNLQVTLFQYLFLKVYFIDYAITVVPIFFSHLSTSAVHPPPSLMSPALSSCPWVIHIRSLASPFPILFFKSPYFVPTNYASYSLYLFPHSPPHSPH